MIDPVGSVDMLSVAPYLLPGDRVSQVTTYGVALGDFLVFLRRVASSPKVQVKMTTPRWTELLLTITGCHKDSGKRRASQWEHVERGSSAVE